MATQKCHVSGLQEELRSLDAEALLHNEAMRRIEQKRKLIQTLIDLETKTGAPKIEAKEASIGAVLGKRLLDGPTTKDSLNEAAESAGFSSPGRSVHATLMNMLRRGEVVQTSDDTFGLTEKGMEALSR